MDNFKEAWEPTAHRGQLDLEIMTRARAQSLGVILPREAEYLGVIKPDGGADCPVGFVSIAALRVFIDEMQPRHVHVAPGDERTAIEAALSRQDNVLH